MNVSVSDLEEKLNFLKVDLPINFTEKIGEGGSAIVCKYTVRKKVAAVKLWKQELPKRKVLKVCEKLRKLRCPNIVRFRGYSLRPSAFIYEYCSMNIEGDDITNVAQLIDIWNEMSYFEFSKRISILQQSANGLRYLHESELIHQDFKPSNLLVSGTQDNIIADFDDIFLIKSTVANTQTNTNFKGMTLTYAAPELCNRSVRHAIKSSDIFSWAITAFEIMTGIQPPWINVLPYLNDALLLEAIRSNERPSLNEIVDKYDEEESCVIKNLIANGWVSDPNKRPSIQQVYL